MAKRKTAAEREEQRRAARSAAEADAAEMLLAAGVRSDADRAEAVRELLEGAPGPPALVYTVQEFCDAMQIGLSTFYRLRREGRGPKVVRILGMPRIRADDAQAWLDANAEVDPQRPLDLGDDSPVVPIKRRGRHVVIPPSVQQQTKTAKPLDFRTMKKPAAVKAAKRKSARGDGKPQE